MNGDQARSRKENLIDEIKKLEQHRDLLSRKLAALQKQRLLETRVEEKFRLNPVIEETKTDRDLIDQQIGALQDQLTIAPSPPKIAISNLRQSAKRLVGRNKELRRLTTAWKSKNTHIFALVAWGGVGKTSLAHEWMSRFATKKWQGVDRYFDWSFYSQGTREQSSASADQFIDAALRFFGDPDPTAGSPHDRGDRLSQLVAQHKTLLILDGLEPLQYPPGPLAGELKDPGLKALLKGLAQRPFEGLCVITTREPLTDLAASRTAVEWKLEHLSEEAGAKLLWQAGTRYSGAKEIDADDSELKAASREVNGHALTLQLLGRYLDLITPGYQTGDIRQRDRIDLQHTPEAGHAFRAMGAYVHWLNTHDTEAQCLLAVLRLLGLFDRPANSDCLDALRAAPAIAGLTEPLQDLSDLDWTITLNRLSELELITLDAKSSVIHSIDTHPLIREYFARELKEQRPDSWQVAHRRLYEYLTETTEHQPDDLAGLQPLYQAVAHGCWAGLHEQALIEIYWNRINRGEGAFIAHKLGAFGDDLGALTCFFDQPWQKLSPNLKKEHKAFLFSQTGFRLQALGRLSEALQLMKLGLGYYKKQKEWYAASRVACSLSESSLTLGQVTTAVCYSEQSIEFADKSSDNFMRMVNRAKLGDALHQVGRRREAILHFQQSEKIQRTTSQPNYALLYSLPGFHYCDALLAKAELEFWRSQLVLPILAKEDLKQTCDKVIQRSTQTLEWAKRNEAAILDIALQYLVLARTMLYSLTINEVKLIDTQDYIEKAIENLRQSNSSIHLCLGLLTRTLFHYASNVSDASEADLDEAWDIAARGSMKLHMADVLLHRARLFRNKKDLAAAKKLVEECGYHRRDVEIADAERAAEFW